MAGTLFKNSESTVGHKIQRGGTLLYSARYPQFAQTTGQLRGVTQLNKFGLTALVVIGGDGYYHGHLALTRHGFNTIGLPGTIHKHIPYTHFTIGLHTAVNTVVTAVDRLRDTAHSTTRTFVLQVMGRTAGTLDLWSGVAGGATHVLIPTHDFDVKKIASLLQSSRTRGQKTAVILLATGDMHADQFAKTLAAYGHFQLRATVLGTIVRGGAHSARHRVLASQMGAYAVTLLLQGKGALAVGLTNNKITATHVRTLLHAKHHATLSLYTLATQLNF